MSQFSINSLTIRISFAAMGLVLLALLFVAVCSRMQTTALYIPSTNSFDGASGRSNVDEGHGRAYGGGAYGFGGGYGGGSGYAAPISGIGYGGGGYGGGGYGGIGYGAAGLSGGIKNNYGGSGYSESGTMDFLFSCPTYNCYRSKTSVDSVCEPSGKSAANCPAIKMQAVSRTDPCTDYMWTVDTADRVGSCSRFYCYHLLNSDFPEVDPTTAPAITPNVRSWDADACSNTNAFYCVSYSSCVSSYSATGSYGPQSVKPQCPSYFCALDEGDNTFLCKLH